MNNSNLVKLTLIISVLALVGSILAIFILLTSPSDKAMVSEEDSKPRVQRDGTIPDLPSDLGIAYINLDTLLLEYKLAVKLQEELLTEKSRSQANLENQLRQLERDYNEFMEKAQLGSFLSQASMEAQQQDIIDRQQRLERLDRELSENLMRKQENMNLTLYDTIMNFMRQYEDSHYTLVLGNAAGANVLYAKPEMNITREVIDALNDRYDRRNQ